MTRDPQKFFFDSELGPIVANIEAGEMTLREGRMELNRIVREWLEEQPIMHGKLQDSFGYGFAFTTTRGPADTHRGRLVDIRPVQRPESK